MSEKKTNQKLPFQQNFKMHLYHFIRYIIYFQNSNEDIDNDLEPVIQKTMTNRGSISEASES